MRLNNWNLLPSNLYVSYAALIFGSLLVLASSQAETSSLPPQAPLAPPLQLKAPTITQVTHSPIFHPASTPSFTAVGGGKLRLWWHYTTIEDDPNSPDFNKFKAGTTLIGSALWHKKAFQLVNHNPKTDHGWPVTLQIIDPAGDVKSGEAAQVHFYSVPESPSVIAVLPAGSEAHQSFDTDFLLLPQTQNMLAASKTPPLQVGEIPKLPLTTPYASLPNSIEIPLNQRPKPFGDLTWEELETQGNTTSVADMEYLHPRLALSPDGKRWFLSARTGESKDYQILFTLSQDAGKTWTIPTLLGLGINPVICRTAYSNLLLFFVYDQDHFSGGPKLKPLLMRRSKDEGKTWIDQQIIANDPLCDQSSVCVGPDGCIWVVYRRNDDLNNAKTSLWLISSSDEGKSWTPPLRITDGKGYDRQPDITVYNNQIMIAYTHSAPSLISNIWLARIKLPRS